MTAFRAATPRRRSTPLHFAAWNCRTAAAQALLEAGADASLKKDGGETALDLAVREGYPEVAACIRLCGARQRLAFATAMLPVAEATAGLTELLPFDVLLPVGEAVAALGPAAEPVAWDQWR